MCLVYCTGGTENQTLASLLDPWLGTPLLRSRSPKGFAQEEMMGNGYSLEALGMLWPIKMNSGPRRENQE